MKKDIHVKSKARYTLSETARFLRELAEKIESGKVTVVQGEEKMDIKLPKSVQFEFKVLDKPTKKTTWHKMGISLKWSKDEKTPASISLA